MGRKHNQMIICSERERRILHACLGRCIDLRDKAFFKGYFGMVGEDLPSLEEMISLMVRLFPDHEEG
jgi:hypothetical protein